MKLEIPRFTERFGAVSLHSVQKVYELDSGAKQEVYQPPQTIRKVETDEVENMESKLAIVIPIKNEKLKIFEGVLSGIPHDCFNIIVSNSDRHSVDRFKMERSAVEQYNRFVGRDSIIIHQKDPGLGEIMKELEYNDMLENGTVRNGKAESMIIGMLLAKMVGKEYVGFIDADNYVPGAVNEYVKIFASCFVMANTPYTMSRISWVYKPKVSEGGGLYFPKWGRISEYTNNYLNSVVSHHTGFETDICRTGNSGEHAMSMKLAELLTYTSGFAIEPYEIMNILEEFGGTTSSNQTEALDKGVEIFQVETRNPHFHEEKGEEHLREMLLCSLASIYNSGICPLPLKDRILMDLRTNTHLGPGEEPPELHKIHSFKFVDIHAFEKLLREKSSTMAQFHP
ncbi:MAG: mannosyl-3-phosphoglycerate synthase [Nitrososphaerales archaeon]